MKRAAVFLVITALFVSGCQGRDKLLYKEAEGLWFKEGYEAAASKFRVVAEEYPKSPYASQALFRLGEIHYLNFHEPDKALTYFMRVVERKELGDTDLKAREYIGELHANALQNFDLAILQYRKIIADYKERVSRDKYQYKLANTYFRKGDYEQAIVEYQTILEKYKKSSFTIDASYQIANCQFVKGESEKALVLFSELLKKYPNTKYKYDIKLGIAISLEELPDLKKALKEYEKLLEEYPDKLIVKKKIASILHRLEKKITR